MAGASSCKACSAGFFAGSQGKTLCVSCSAGSYATSSGASTCAACPAGYYCEGGSSKAGCPVNSLSSGFTYHITGCVCNAGYSGHNGGNCSPCRPGSFCPGASKSNCSRPSLRLTWLFRNEETGVYFLNLPKPVQSMKNYNARVESDVWQKVRINSTLRPDLEEVQLRTAAMHLNAVSYSCINVDIGCTQLQDGAYQEDTSYVSLADSSKVSCNFASACACGSVATSDIDLAGTPFRITGGQNAWFTCCSYAHTFQSFCANEQHCSAQIEGHCANAIFNGRLGILNRSQYLQDVNLACSLYPRDPQLQCSGDKIPYNCDPALSFPCPAGSISQAGTYTEAASVLSDPW
jgi:hypothetical protein